MESLMKVVCIVQARLDSKRLKNKVLMKLFNKRSIFTLLDRVNKAKFINDLVVAIPEKDTKLYNNLSNKGFNVFKGSEHDVLSRYYYAALEYNAKVIVRITGDCPLVDPDLVSKLIKKFKCSNYDYISNIDPPTYPDGLDVEVFSLKALKKAFDESKLAEDREHVTRYMLKNKNFKKFNYENTKDFSFLRLTIDNRDDLLLIKKILKYFSTRKKNFLFKDIIELYQSNKNLFNKNIKYYRNTGTSKLSSGQKLWHEAKRYIAGGNMLFSKRPDVFLPENWPSYFKKTKGCKVTDLDNKTYFDISNMSVGTNSLGYSHREVDNAVKKIVKKGNMSTLNCPEEVYLAEKLIKIHPWADKVRFARTGGEANSIAIRLARASTKKNNIAFCGYHGWHDWYLAANIRSKKNLAHHLLGGLNVEGVPKILNKTIFPFRYNDFDGLKKIIKKNNIGIIKMEVIRNEQPKRDFLRKIRNLADKEKVILIFDECTTGFRQTFGGIHKLYKVNPDLLILGKALGNGYAITAVLGKKDLMNSINKTFISSTFWTERIGPTAGLKTLEVMKREKSWKKITNIGISIIRRWKKLAKKHSLKIKISGIPALCSFLFISKYNNEYKTFITQEMLKRGFLVSNVVYSSLAHKEKILKKYFKELDIIFKKIKKFENGKNIYNYLRVKPSTQTFGKVN